MKVVNERNAFLLDYEVLDHLQHLKKKYNWTFTPEEDAQNNGKKKRFTAAGLGLEVVTRDVTLCLSKSPAGGIPDAEVFKQLMVFLNQFELVKVEKLQIVNSLPRLMVHLYALVEECDLRFDEDTCERILAKINELVPAPEGDDEEMEEEQ